MHLLPDYFVIFILVASIIEISWSKVKKKTVFNFAESLGNFGLLVGNNLMKPLSSAWKYWVLGGLASFKFFKIPTNILTIVLTSLIAEFGYHWYHGWSHEIPPLWTLHHTHHSATKMNLTTAVRLNGLGSFVSPLIYVLFVLLGFSYLDKTTEEC